MNNSCQICERSWNTELWAIVCQGATWVQWGPQQTGKSHRPSPAKLGKFCPWMKKMHYISEDFSKKMGKKLVTLTLTGQVGRVQTPPKCWHPQATAPRCGHAASLLLKLGHWPTNTQGQTDNLLGSPKLSFLMEKYSLDPLEALSVLFEFQLHFKIFLIKHT